jgi:excinuclease UvrABC ATPase subunit
VLTVVTGVSGSGKSTYQENIVSCNAKKLDNAGRKQVSLVR